MKNKNYIFTSESVSEGHPDKVADQISDAILDAHLVGDNRSRVAIETLVTTDRIILSGEITSRVKVDYEKIAREVVKGIGYDHPGIMFDGNSCNVETYVHSQSHDISVGVTEGEGLYKEQGAGDQGMMFGFAINETPELMPMPIHFSHRLVKRLADVRKSGELDFLRPDAKSQVTVQYENGKPKRIDAIVLSTQHVEDVTQEKLKEALIESVVKNVIPANLLDNDTNMYINPTGVFVIGGPHGDTGLTGRKIIVDTYGGMGQKILLLQIYLADRCEVQLSYAIGVPHPVSVMVDTFGTGKVSDEIIAKKVNDTFDMSPHGIMTTLDLLRPIYGPTAAYGHFGREDEGFPWELKNRIDQLKG